MKKTSIALLILATSPASADGDRTYVVRRGDTLSSISKRLFGDSRSWPTLWKLNGDKIPNPNLIRPSSILTFSPGTTTRLPSLEVTDSIRTSAAAPKKKKRSQEWRDLPRQSWERIDVVRPVEVDELGFDLRTRYSFPPVRGLDLPWIAASGEIEELASISSAKDENRILTVNDTVYLRDYDESLKPGATYAITTEPAVLKESFFSRRGYAYPILGKVKILGMKEDTWIEIGRAHV